MTINTLDVHTLRQHHRSVSKTMLLVMLALLPGTILYASLIDSRIIINILLTGSTAVIVEFACVSLRQRPAFFAIRDCSAFLAAWLLALCVPPSLPMWQLIIGSFTLVTLGKHLFGGLGQNPFNPAMVAYAVLLVSFPVTMTQWQIPEQSVLLTSTTQMTSPPKPTMDGTTPSATEPRQWDGISGATALDRLRATRQELNSQINASEARPLAQNPTFSEPATISQLRDQASSLIFDSREVLVSIGWLAGGLCLLLLRVISWHIPVSILGCLVCLYGLGGLFATGPLLPVLPALLSGGIMLGAFFIATDPVSAATSRQGKIVYGLGVGVLAFVIREYSVYPEGVAFAVLLMNMCVPLIDYLSTGKGGGISIARKSE